MSYNSLSVDDLVVQLFLSVKNLLETLSGSFLLVRLVHLIGHSNHILDEWRNDRTLGCSVKEVGWVDIYFEEYGTQISIEHEVKPENFKTTKSTIQPVLRLNED